MQKPSAALESFFRAYETSVSASDYPAVAAHFADTFIAAGPEGSQAVRASDFALVLPRRRQMFERFRTVTSMESIEETPLDGRHRLARVRWRMTFAPEGKTTQSIDLDSTFLVDMGANPPKILVYLSHQDLMATLRAHGEGPA